VQPACPNVTAHPSTASVPITILLYNGQLVCDFNVPTKGLPSHTVQYPCLNDYAVSTKLVRPCDKNTRSTPADDATNVNTG